MCLAVLYTLLVFNHAVLKINPRDNCSIDPQFTEEENEEKTEQLVFTDTK